MGPRDMPPEYVVKHTVALVYRPREAVLVGKRLAVATRCSDHDTSSGQLRYPMCSREPPEEGVPANAMLSTSAVVGKHDAGSRS